MGLDTYISEEKESEKLIGENIDDKLSNLSSIVDETMNYEKEKQKNFQLIKEWLNVALDSIDNSDNTYHREFDENGFSLWFTSLSDVKVHLDCFSWKLFCNNKFELSLDMYVNHPEIMTSDNYKELVSIMFSKLKDKAIIAAQKDVIASQKNVNTAQENVISAQENVISAQKDEITARRKIGAAIKK